MWWLVGKLLTSSVQNTVTTTVSDGQQAVVDTVGGASDVSDAVYDAADDIIVTPQEVLDATEEAVVESTDKLDDTVNQLGNKLIAEVGKSLRTAAIVGGAVAGTALVIGAIAAIRRI